RPRAGERRGLPRHRGRRPGDARGDGSRRGAARSGVIPVLSRAQMRAFDAHAIERCRVPSVVLMEDAGRGACDVLTGDLLEGEGRGARVVLVCGTGNNGGDGFVVARHLRLRGVDVETWLVGRVDKVSGDARANLDAWVGLGGSVHELAADAAPLAKSLERRA